MPENAPVVTVIAGPNGAGNDVSDNNPIDDAVVRGVRQALAVHKRLGRSVVSVVDGKTVVIPPEEIDVDIEESKRPRGLEALRPKV